MITTVKEITHYKFKKIIEFRGFMSYILDLRINILTAFHSTMIMRLVRGGTLHNVSLVKIISNYHSIVF